MIQKEAEKREAIIKEDMTKIKRSKFSRIKTNLDKFAEAAT